MSVKQGLKFGLAAGVGFLLVLGTALLAQVVVAQFTSGEQLTAQKLNDNFASLKIAIEGTVPVGTIMAWDKSFPGVPALPDGWVECNGQVLSDPASPLHGQTIRNLNSTARFLRGGSTSGTFQADAFQGHYHYNNPNQLSEYIMYGNFGGGAADYRPVALGAGFSGNYPELTTGAVTTGTSGVPRTATETRPTNMSVVWIMKVK